MGKNQRRLMQFALAYPYSWHAYGTDRSTVEAVRVLRNNGLITLSAKPREFRLNVPERYFDAMTREAKRTGAA